MARRFGSMLAYDDLFGCGAEGLLQAAQRFDPARGVPFGAFARTRIQGAMIDAVRKEIGRAPAEASADEARTERREAAAATARQEGWVCEAAYDASEWVACSRDEGPEAATLDAERRRSIDDAVGELPDAERVLVERHLLLDESLESAARSAGVSPARAAQLLCRARGRLAHSLRGGSVWG